MSKRTRTTARRAVPALASVAALGALAVLPTAGDAATRHVPGAGNGLQVTTSAPDLRSVDLRGNQQVGYCFDQPLQGAVAQDGFYVQTYDASRYFQSTSAQFDVNNPNCVVATFGANVDLAQGTIGSISGGAANASGGLAALPASEPLGGSGASPRAGDTTGPDLLSVSVDRQNKRISYNFDEQIGTTANTPANFTFTDDAGNTRPATALDTSGATVTATFAQDPGQATRAAVANGAVTDRAASGTYVAGRALTTPNGAAAIGIGTTSLATIQGASGGPKIYTVKYDVGVNEGTAARFRAVLDNGETFNAASVAGIDSDATSLRVIFPDALDAAAGHVVRIVDLGGGGVARSGGVGTGPSSFNVGTPENVPGKTNGPDLLSASYDTGSNLATFNFDAGPASDTNTAFYTVASSGNATTTTQPSTRGGNSVTVPFPSTARTSIGAGVQVGAVRDGLGNPSPYSTIAYQTEAAPNNGGGGGGGGTTTGTTPVTPPATTPPATTTPPAATPKPRASTSVSIRRTSSRITGTVKSQGRGCQVGRKVSLKRIGRSKALKTTSTNSKGVYRFKRTSSTRGKKVRVVVSARTGTYAICGSKTSKTIRG